MPKSKPTLPQSDKARVTKKTSAQEQFSPEYEEYLERYALTSAGRPRLSPQEFEQYDDELLDLLDLIETDLTDEQIIRIQELEYLLIDTE